MKIQLLTYMLVALSLLTAVSAFNNVTESGDVDVEWIKVNGDIYDTGDTIRVDVGDVLDIRIKMQARGSVDDVETSARLIGYEYNDRERVFDFEELVDLKSGDTDFSDLSIEIPQRADKDTYELRVNVDSRRDTFAQKSFTIRVSGPRNEILIKDIIFSPSGTVVAGRSLLAQVRLENIGERDQDDVKVTAAIPALGLEGSVFVEEVEGEDDFGRGEKITSEEIYLRLPPCAAPGTYQVRVDVEFDEFDEVSATDTITVLESDLCPTSGTGKSTSGQTVITAPQTQNIQAGGAGASFPVVIRNDGSAAQTYQVSVQGVESWGTSQVSEQSPVVSPGESGIVYVFVSVNENAPLGLQTFGIEVNSDTGKQTVLAQANVVESQERSSVSGVLPVILIVLIIILLILGFIVVFAKLREKDDGSEKGQAYY